MNATYEKCVISELKGMVEELKRSSEAEEASAHGVKRGTSQTNRLAAWNVTIVEKRRRSE